MLVSAGGKVVHIISVKQLQLNVCILFKYTLRYLSVWNDVNCNVRVNI